MQYLFQLLHSATRIAELYLDLQRAGDVTYINSCLMFTCVHGCKFEEENAKLRIAALQHYTKTLDNQLITWKRSLDDARGHFYELNYFTTLQLLELRKELGMLAHMSAPHVVKPHVLMLLSSISHEVSASALLDSLQAVNLSEPEPMAIDKPKVETETVTQQLTLSNTGLLDVPSTTAALLSTQPLSPILTLEKLTEQQQHAYTHCVEFLGHSETHVWKALQVCGPNATVIDLEGWCEVNEDTSSPVKDEVVMEVPTDDAEGGEIDSDENIETQYLLPSQTS